MVVDELQPVDVNLVLLQIDLRETSAGLLGFSNTFGKPDPVAGIFRIARALRPSAEVITLLMIRSNGG